jgi:methionyl-tRNA synthetase
MTETKQTTKPTTKTEVVEDHSKDPKYIYIATAIPYVNDVPHLGHALLHTYGDAFARYHRMFTRNSKVIYSAGTDEHGGKIAEKANEEGMDIQEFVDKNAQSFKDMLNKLVIENDRFIQTTNPAHEQIAAKIWENLKPYIKKGKYSGLYCVGCEKYVTETQAKEDNSICPDHNREYEKFEEENYIFELSKFTDRILDAIENDDFKIRPEGRKHEIVATLKAGLEDISISRPASKIGWGIPVPGDKTQTMYVWFEALMNYITVLGYPDSDDFKNYWPATIQVLGKDILRFHAAIWPAMLMGLGIPLPKMVYAHGFIIVEGKKMSKSLGNTVTVDEIIEKFGVDTFRYFFLRYMPQSGDLDFSWDRLEASYNGELANELGNLVSRVSAMVVRYQQGVIGEMPGPTHDIASYHEAFANARVDLAVEMVWSQVRSLNQYIEEEKPWEIATTGDQDHLREVLAYAASSIMEIAQLLAPIMPVTSHAILNVFSSGQIKELPGPLFPRTDKPKK